MLLMCLNKIDWQFKYCQQLLQDKNRYLLINLVTFKAYLHAFVIYLTFYCN